MEFWYISTLVEMNLNLKWLSKQVVISDRENWGGGEKMQSELNSREHSRGANARMTQKYPGIFFFIVIDFYLYFLERYGTFDHFISTHDDTK